MMEVQHGESASSWLQRLLADSKAHGLSYVDVEPFLSPYFDPQEYANTIIDAPASGLASTSRQSSATAAAVEGANWLPQAGRFEGDLSVALGRLNLAIEDVDRLVRDEVTSNASTLLAHTTTLLDLRPMLATLTSSLASLDTHQDKLVARISAPRQALQSQTHRLSRMRSAQTLVRQAQRLVRLLRRLQGQLQGLGDRRNDNKERLEKLGEEDGEEDGGAASVAVDDILDAESGEQAGRGLSRAALTVAEILTMLPSSLDQQQPETISIAKEEQDGTGVEDQSILLSLAFVQHCIPMVEQARERVTDLMEDMIVRGLRDLSPTLLSTSLQTAFNLGRLTDLVRDLLADLTDVVRDRVRAAFDMDTLARELGSKEPLAPHSTAYRARRGEFSSASNQRWSNAIWHRLETLVIGEMGAVCSKVYTLERVLSLKNDSVTRSNYLEQAINALGDRPSTMFWSTLGSAIEAEARRCNSSFLVQTLEQGYPRLLRIFQEFYAKVSVFTSTSYSHTQQSPETLVILRSLARFEESFMAKSSSRFASMLDNSFTARQVPGPKEAIALSKLALSELDAARLDPLLLHAVGKIVCDRLDEATRRIEALVIRDNSTQPMQQLNRSHVQNASLSGAAYQLGLGLQRVAEQGPLEYRSRMLELYERVQEINRSKLIEPTAQSVCKELSDVMSRMHYVDFSLDRDAVSGSGSAYMADLSDRLWFVREQLLVQYDIPTGTLLLRIAKHALHSFVMHASLIRPLAEGGKLKLTSDMTELEFSVSQLLASAHHVPAPLSMADCGVEFRALRTFRHLLFMDVGNWTSPEEELRAGLSPLAAAHHIVCRSQTIPLPHELHKWSRVEYLRWLDSHSQQDGMQLIKGCLEVWRADSTNEEESKQGKLHDDGPLAVCLDRIVYAADDGSS